MTIRIHLNIIPCVLCPTSLRRLTATAVETIGMTHIFSRFRYTVENGLRIGTNGFAKKAIRNPASMPAKSVTGEESILFILFILCLPAVIFVISLVNVVDRQLR